MDVLELRILVRKPHHSITLILHYAKFPYSIIPIFQDSYCLNRENTCSAVLAKIFALSSAVSHGMLSILGRTSSYHLPVRGSVLEPAPGRSVPNRQRSGPTILNSSFNDSTLY